MFANLTRTVIRDFALETESTKTACWTELRRFDDQLHAVVLLKTTRTTPRRTLDNRFALHQERSGVKR